VTNVIFGFETSPNTNPKRKKWGDMAHNVPPSKNVGGDTSPVPPTKLRPWLWMLTKLRPRTH